MILALLTDFGLSDCYVGVMKAVATSIHPEARIIDLSHGIEAQNIKHARAFLEDNLSYLPEGSVVCVVVDPGVGSKRKAIALKYRGYFLVGPDNSLLANFLKDACKIVSLPVPKKASATFHGRDVFIPAAARISSGIILSDLGDEITPRDCVGLQGTKEHHFEIIYKDHFGNLVSNLRLKEDPINFKFIYQGQSIEFHSTYSSMPEGKLCAIRGSTNRLELSVKNSSAYESIGKTKDLKPEVLSFDSEFNFSALSSHWKSTFRLKT